MRNSSKYPGCDPNWYKTAVGGMWEGIGRLQFNYLTKNGLKPHHYFLDVGCGSLRGGIHFIRYLLPKHYFGIDIDEDLLKAGLKEVEVGKLEYKKPYLLKMGDFNFKKLKQKFDYALAQSVFTHLPLNSIIRCIINIEKVLVKRGRFYATFFECSKKKFCLEELIHRSVDGSNIKTYFDQDPYHYSFNVFKWICTNTCLKVKYIGDWNHPRKQKMMVFTRLLND